MLVLELIALGLSAQQPPLPAAAGRGRDCSALTKTQGLFQSGLAVLSLESSWRSKHAVKYHSAHSLKEGCSGIEFAAQGSIAMPQVAAAP